MPSTIGKGKLFRIKHITLLEGATFLRNKHEIAFFDIKYTFFGRKENTISGIITIAQTVCTFSRNHSLNVVGQQQCLLLSRIKNNKIVKNLINFTSHILHLSLS